MFDNIFYMSCSKCGTEISNKDFDIKVVGWNIWLEEENLMYVSPCCQAELKSAK